MFEFSIVINDNKIEEAKNICRELKKNTQEFGAVITSYSENDKIYIILACEDIEKPRMKFFISDAIADTISIFYKLEFLEKNLKLHIKNDVYLYAFQKALIAFDRETDKYLITHNLKLEKNIFIDSFYQFKLKQLRGKWFELIKLANENAGYLLCSDTFIDLLRFLIENIEISSELINVVKKEEDYLVCDEKFNKINVEEGICLLKNENEDTNINLITSLISLSPRKINVYCDLNENNPSLTFISQIFGNRVSILPNVNF
ncbi:MAG: sporulation protein YtxC [Clostridia bacterium]|nr:sporulation protein YtxC [Clostridia bacterium]